jgi:hypothetical protein
MASQSTPDFLTRASPARYRSSVASPAGGTSRADRNQLSLGSVIAIGLLMGILGSIVILVALGTFGEQAVSDGTPPWVGVAAGLTFVMCGLAMIVGYGIAGGAAPDGDLLPGTPVFVRLVQTGLGLGIVAMLASIASWIAFGPGVRHFTGTGLFIGGVVGETVGRVGAVLAWAVMAALLVVSIKRLRRG